MNECLNFTKTLKVGRWGDKIWLGKANYLAGMMVLVTYYLNGDEISDFFEPIVDGDNIYLDLSNPDEDYYNQYKTYYISLTDTSGYYSNGIQMTNEGLTHDGFIVNFSNAENARDRLVIVE